MTLPPLLVKHAERALQGLMLQAHGVVAAVVSTADGFDVASHVTKADAGGRLAAMASSISAICSVVSEESDLGANQSICIESQNGYVVMVQVPHAAYPMILNVVANKGAVLAQLVYFARQTAQQLGEAP